MRKESLVFCLGERFLGRVSGCGVLILGEASGSRKKVNAGGSMPGVILSGFLCYNCQDALWESRQNRAVR